MQTDDQITPEPADGLAEAHARLAGSVSYTHLTLPTILRV